MKVLVYTRGSFISSVICALYVEVVFLSNSSVICALYVEVVFLYNSSVI